MLSRHPVPTRKEPGNASLTEAGADAVGRDAAGHDGADAAQPKPGPPLHGVPPAPPDAGRDEHDHDHVFPRFLDERKIFRSKSDERKKDPDPDPSRRRREVHKKVGRVWVKDRVRDGADQGQNAAPGECRSDRGQRRDDTN